MPRFSLVEDAPKGAHGGQTGNKLLREAPARPGGTRRQGRRSRLGGASTEAGFSTSWSYACRRSGMGLARAAGGAGMPPASSSRSQASMSERGSGGSGRDARTGSGQPRPAPRPSRSSCPTTRRLLRRGGGHDPVIETWRSGHARTMSERSRCPQSSRALLRGRSTKGVVVSRCGCALRAVGAALPAKVIVCPLRARSSLARGLLARPNDQPAEVGVTSASSVRSEPLGARAARSADEEPSTCASRRTAERLFSGRHHARDRTALL